MPTKIFLAGLEGYGHQDALNKVAAPHRLTTFFAFWNLQKGKLKKKPEELERLMRDNNPPGQKVFVDSGTFSLMREMGFDELSEEDGAGPFSPEEYWRKLTAYWEGYIAFVVKWHNEGLLWTAVDLDIDAILAPPHLRPKGPKLDSAGDKRRRAIVEACPKHLSTPRFTRGEAMDMFEYPYDAIVALGDMLQDTGVPVIRSWQKYRGPNRGFSEWKYMCQHHRYVGFAREAIPRAHWGPYYQEAVRHGTLIHGFAMTKMAWLKDWAFYTVDSSTWLAGVEYANTHIFNPASGFIETASGDQRKETRWFHKQWYIDAGIITDETWHLVEKEDVPTINAMCALEWTKFANFQETAPTPPAYWQYDHLGNQVSKKMAPRLELKRRDAYYDADKDAFIGGHCDGCNIQNACEHAQSGYDCYYKMPKMDARDPSSRATMLNLITQMQMQRVFISGIQERRRGGGIDPQVSKAIAQLQSFLTEMEKMQGVALPGGETPGAPADDPLTALLASAGLVQITAVRDAPAAPRAIPGQLSHLIEQ